MWALFKRIYNKIFIPLKTLLNKIDNYLLVEMSSSRMAKIDTISTNTTRIVADVTSIYTYSSRGVIKSIQRGNRAGSGDNITINISTVVPSKSMVILNGSLTDAGVISGSSFLPTLVSISANSFVVSRAGHLPSSGSFSNQPFSWQVIEFY